MIVANTALNALCSAMARMIDGSEASSMLHRIVKFHEANREKSQIVNSHERHLTPGLLLSATYADQGLARRLHYSLRHESHTKNRDPLNMQRIIAINPAEATGKTKKLLDGVQAKLGMTPNLMKTLATAPAALEAYLGFGAALGTGVLDAKFREQISLAVAQANSCEYCLSAHAAIGAMVGLSREEITGSREARAEDAKRDAGLKFAQSIVVQRGEVSDATLGNVREAGFTDGEITEIVANVAVNIFTNYFNHVAETEIDFLPKVETKKLAAAA